jgi:DNA polymerase (family 10)
VLAGGWPELEEARKEGPRVAAQQAEVESHGRGGGSLLAALKGDLHVHTDATDGRDPLPDMVEAAKRRGYEYVAITDHSKETRIAGGLDETAMRLHHARIRRLAERTEGITVLAGAEVDILKDGRLDFPDSLLKDMDVVVCSLHFRHKLDAKAQTERILKAMANENADILGHPTGRRRGIRPGIDLDLPRIVEAARQQGWAIEMNGSPERLDLDAKGGALAASSGVLLSLDSDAHATEELAQVRNCCREAEAAGIAPAQVLNAQPLSRLQRLLAV